MQDRDECRAGNGCRFMAKSHVSQVSPARLRSGRGTCGHLMSDATSGMQMPVGTAQEGCVTQMPPCLSRDSSGFVLAVHRCRSFPKSWFRTHMG